MPAAAPKPRKAKKAAGSSKKPGLYANIHAKQQRIAHGSGEKMRKPHSEGAPSDEAFEKSARTAHHRKSKPARNTRRKRAKSRSRG
ncbi:hypothetical protein GN316_20105 [Xylophilus sp. Kf1]|nr:hypothetical protein [Xylophilus sp. Kf1]